MKHLTDEQLSRRLDGALEGRALAEVEAHLAACGACREALATLVANDAALRPALSHDPGPEYFQTFAARVEDRIRAAGLSGAQARERGTGAWGSPRRLAWIGGVAAVVVGAALALIQTRIFIAPDFRDRDLSSRLEAPAEPGDKTPAPEVGAKESDDAGAQRQRMAKQRANEPEMRMKANSDELTRQAAGTLAKDEGVGATGVDRAESNAARETTAPSRAQKVQRDARGEDVPVGETRTFAQPPAAAPAPSTTSADGKRVGRAGVAQPMREAPAEEQEAGSSLTASPKLQSRGGRSDEVKFQVDLAAGETPLCGEVVDMSGRPVAAARVALAKLGRTVSTDTNGRFCIGAPPGDHEVAVMAVGFRESRQQVRVAGESAEVRLIVNAVDVLEAAPVLVAKSSAARPDPFAALPDSVRVRAAEAQRLSARAESLGTAGAHDAAAEAWARSLRGVPAGPAQIAGRQALAESRYRAWERGATTARRNAAADAITAWLAIAPAGPQRDEAAGWLERLGR